MQKVLEIPPTSSISRTPNDKVKQQQPLCAIPGLHLITRQSRLHGGQGLEINFPHRSSLELD